MSKSSSADGVVWGSRCTYGGGAARPAVAAIDALNEKDPTEVCVGVGWDGDGMG